MSATTPRPEVPELAGCVCVWLSRPELLEVQHSLRLAATTLACAVADLARLEQLEREELQQPLRAAEAARKLAHYRHRRELLEAVLRRLEAVG